jgi:D-amino peptidase
MATWVGGVVRTGGTTVAITGDDPLEVFRRFITAVLLTRDIAE